MASDLFARTEVYRCPGEPYTINRAEHLGRLAAFYEKCRHCPHRDDADTLAPRRRKQLATVAAREPANLRVGPDSISGWLRNELTLARAENLAAGFAARLPRPPFGEPSPTVYFAYDGRPSTVEWLIPITRGLRWGAANVINLGAASVGQLAAEATSDPDAAALYLGNDRGHDATASLSFWTPGFEPIDSPGRLDDIATAADVRGDRPARRFGAYRTQSSTGEHLSNVLTELKLKRQIRIVVDVRNQPTARDLQYLLESSPCELTWLPRPKHLSRANRLRPASQKPKPHERWFPPNCADAAVVIDGDGEAVRLFDELARPVDPPALLYLLAEHAAKESGTGVIRFASTLPDTVLAAVEGLGFSVRATEDSTSTRQSLLSGHRALSAQLSGDNSGRFLIGAETAYADALRTLATLLSALAADERPLSVRLDRALARHHTAR